MEQVRLNAELVRKFIADRIHSKRDASLSAIQSFEEGGDIVINNELYKMSSSEYKINNIVVYYHSDYGIESCCSCDRFYCKHIYAVYVYLNIGNGQMV